MDYRLTHASVDSCNDVITFVIGFSMLDTYT